MRLYLVLTCSSLPLCFYRGILAVAWSMADPELLLSCGKDAKILCSNPNTGEVGRGTLQLFSTHDTLFPFYQPFPNGFKPTGGGSEMLTHQISVRNILQLVSFNV